MGRPEMSKNGSHVRNRLFLQGPAIGYYLGEEFTKLLDQLD